MKFMNVPVSLAMGAALATGAAAAGPAFDFGAKVENWMESLSLPLFGVKKPMTDEVPQVTAPYRTMEQKSAEQIVLAKGLRARYLTRGAGNAIDQMEFWPDIKRPKFLIACIEGGRAAIGTLPGGAVKYNPSVQSINLRTGEVETILRGMSACDGIRVTPWGTVLATEERDDGGVYEILDPVRAKNLTIINRATGEIAEASGVPAKNARKMTAMPVISYEGLGITPDGVVYAGDELRPGTGSNDADGGALFKFVPAVPHAGGAITSLDESPLASGKVYAMQVSCVDDGQQFGQGCEVGKAAWLEVSVANARTDAHAAGATGYYRPEDGHFDPRFQDPANPNAVRFCWTNTQSESAGSFGEVLCALDTVPRTADATQRTTQVTRFITGDARFNSFDNLDFQPRTGNMFIIEDHAQGDVFSCLPDGQDRDIQTDGCIAIAAVIDPSSEPTGWLFSEDGTRAYVAVQHSNDANMPLVDGYGTDDVLEITGFKIHDGRKTR